MNHVFEKRYVQEQRKNAVLQNRCNEHQEIVKNLQQEIDRLRERVEKHEEEKTYFIDSLSSKKNQRKHFEQKTDSNEDDESSIDRNEPAAKWKRGYEKMEETCRLLKKKLEYPDDFKFPDVVLEEGIKTEVQRLREALKHTAELSRSEEIKSKHKVTVLQRQYAQEKKKSETYRKAAQKADADGEVFTLQREKEGYRATTVRLGMKVNRLEKKLTDLQKHAEQLEKHQQRVERDSGDAIPSTDDTQEYGTKGQTRKADSKKTLRASWAGEDFEPPKPQAVQSKKNVDVDNMIATLSRKVRKLQKRNVKLSDALTMHKVMAEANKTYRSGNSSPPTTNSGMHGSVSPARDNGVNKSAASAATVRARRDVRVKLRLKSQEEEIAMLRRNVAELKASNQTMVSRAATTTHLLAARDAHAMFKRSKKRGASMGGIHTRTMESLEEEVNILRSNNVDLEAELGQVRTALRVEENLSHKREQELLQVKAMLAAMGKSSMNSKSPEKDPYEPMGNDGIPWGEIEFNVKSAGKTAETRKKAMAFVQLQRRVERMYAVLRDKQAEIHQLKVNASKSAPAAQATERALEEYFNEVVRLRDQIAGMKAAFLKTTTKLRSKLRTANSGAEKARAEGASTVQRILEVYPEAIAIVTAGTNTGSWLGRKVRRTAQKESSSNVMAGEEEVMEWGPTQVTAWLATAANMPHHVEAFANEAIDGHLLLTLTDEDLKDDLGMVERSEREALLKEVVKLRSGSKEYQRFFGTGGLGDVGKVERPAKPATQKSDGTERGASSSGGDIWSPFRHSAVSPRDDIFDREISQASTNEDRVRIMKAEIDRLRQAKRNMLDQQDQLKIAFEKEREYLLNEQEESLQAVHAYAQQQMMMVQEGIGNDGTMMMGSPQMTPEEQEEEWKKEQRRMEIEQLKASLGHVDNRGKPLPPKKLPSQMNDSEAPPMQHHSPDLKKQPAKSALKKKGSREKANADRRVRYAGKREKTVAIIPRIDDEDIDKLFWSQEDQELATQEVERLEMQAEMEALKKNGLHIPTFQELQAMKMGGAKGDKGNEGEELGPGGGLDTGGGRMIIGDDDEGGNDPWNMPGVTFAEDDPYYDDDFVEEGNEVDLGSTQRNGLDRSAGFSNLPRSAKEEEDDEEANFSISGSDNDDEIMDESDRF
jgi:hypothetical protein